MTIERRPDESSAAEVGIGGRLPPYQVWASMRILGLVGAAMAVVWLFHTIYALLAAVEGRAVGLLPGWIFLVGVIVGGTGRNWRKDTPPICELIGNLLASKCCPDCGQSVFSDMPPSGYESDLANHSFWPARLCANCGNDMTKRVAK